MDGTTAKALLQIDAALEPIAITIQAAVRFSGVSRSEIYRRLAAGDIEAIKSGARTLILVASLKGYLANLPAAKFRLATSQSAASTSQLEVRQ